MSSDDKTPDRGSEEEQFRATFEQATVGIAHVDLEGKWVRVNTKLCDILGYSEEELLKTNFQQLTHAEDVHNDVESLKRLREGHINTYTTEKRYIKKDGSILWASLAVSLVHHNGKPTYFVSFVQDISLRKKAQQELLLAQAELKHSEKRFRALFEQSLISTQILAPDGTTIAVNHAWERLWGMNIEALHHIKYNMLEDKQLEVKGILQHIRKAFNGTATEIPPILYDPAELGAIGQKRWVRAYIYPIKDEQGSVQEVVLMHEDITERMEAEETIRHNSMHDALTGLSNRSALENQLAHALESASAKGTYIGVIFLDLDRFKTVNDSLGHVVGDLLIKEVASKLRATVADAGIVARLGGDEFIILLENIADVAAVTKLAEEVCKRLQEPIAVSGQIIHTSASQGIAIYPLDGHDVNVLLSNADTALYRAKQAGRNRYQLYNQTMNLRASERFTVENELREALRRDQLTLFYQPIVDGRSKQLVGVEALVRWQHPRLGMIYPNEFIPLAEESGLILPLGEWVLQQACRQNKQWQNEGFPHIRVAVNISATQFSQVNFVSTLAAILKETALETKYLELEITESTAMENWDYAQHTLQNIRNMGVHVTIDDFGIGYSSLSYLKQFPISALKIDESFVRHCVENEQDAAIVRTIIAMARSLRLSVIAEGVESQAQAQFLIGAQCDYLQGYHIAKPASAEEIYEKYKIMP